MADEINMRSEIRVGMDLARIVMKVASSSWYTCLGGNDARRIVTIDLGFVNAYLLRTREGFVLADTGVATQWGKLAAALAAAGCAPASLKLVVITHADMDHAGNARRLQAEWKAPIAIHGADELSLRTGVAPKRSGRGPIASAAMGLMGLMRFFARGVKAEPLHPDFILTDGQNLRAWGLDARHPPPRPHRRLHRAFDGGRSLHRGGRLRQSEPARSFSLRPELRRLPRIPAEGEGPRAFDKDRLSGAWPELSRRGHRRHRGIRRLDDGSR